MKSFKNGNLLVTSNPHMFAPTNTQKIMLAVVIALLPSLIASIVIFGLRALILAIVCVIASVFFEWAYEKLAKKENTVNDLSAVVTGLLLAMNLPVTMPYWQSVVGCFIAIVVVKQFFGGLGQNFANPAITARIVLFVSFGVRMTTWADPKQAKVLLASDAVTSATPLGVFNESGAAEAQSQFSLSDMALGMTGGSMGEVCAVALLAGGLFLIFLKVISPATPLAFLGTIAVMSLLHGDDPIWQICAGGAMIGAFFMATDYATTPTTTLGKVIFGIGCGFITMVIRFWGSYPEGVSFSILLMDIITPHIDHFCENRLYGNPKKAAKAEGGAK
ncbi:MAG: RnfABCDGE type electron transport complex subunit D [Clostridia bacterium]|nr:RnfABCDGE type electron transport complex subunit D [Clostridia bacterium]